MSVAELIAEHFEKIRAEINIIEQIHLTHAIPNAAEVLSKDLLVKVKTVRKLTQKLYDDEPSGASTEGEPITVTIPLEQ